MQKILNQMRKLIEKYDLIQKNDKIAVGISGGKDSLLLITALSEYKKYIFPDFEIVGVTVDPSGGKMNFSEITNYLKKLNVDYKIINSDIFEIVFDIRKEKNPCALCAKLRRGILNSTANELNCNKVALAHHADDLIETFLLSLFFEGRLNAFKPSTYLTQSKLTVIRPLLYVKENDIIKETKNFPVVKNPCKVDKHTKREEAKEILNKLNNIYPNAKEKLLNAIVNSDRYNLW